MLSLFAIHSSNRFVHVSEVERGLACECRCAVCGEVVIARQGEVREHHFAHASNREPCISNHESDLHRFAKRVIIEARSLVVPLPDAAAQILGLEGCLAPAISMECASVQEEVALGDRRPDLLVQTTLGVDVAIEVAYSSFCDATKRLAYQKLRLPALEIDVGEFTPTAFDVVRVKLAILESARDKTWLWPEHVQVEAAEQSKLAGPVPEPRRFLPEEIVTMNGRWISIKQLPSGDIAIKAVRYDIEVVAAIRSVARTNLGHYRDAHHSWVIPSTRALAARSQLRAIASR